MAIKKKTNTPKNNFYWIYASIIFLIISLSFVGGDKGLQNVQQADISSFEDFLSNGDVNKITIVNQRYALVSINENALSKEIHRKVKTKNFLGQENLLGPHYQFEIGNPEIFQKKLDEIKILIKKGIPDAEIVIKDLAGDDNHYSATIKSKLFSGKTKIEQHKLVYKALGGKMGNELHALALNTIES